MKKFFVSLFFAFLVFEILAQEQSVEFNNKIRAESVKVAADESMVSEKNENSVDSENFDSHSNDEKVEANENLTVTKINFIGLKKTRDSYIQSKIKKFIGKPLSEENLHDFETAIQLEGLFDNIKIKAEQTSENEVELNVSVKEKITFIPLPFAMYSNSSFMAGGVIMDVNAFGRKDMFMLGGFFSSSSKTAMASVSKQPKDNGIPGFSIFVSGSKSSPEINDLEDDMFFKYEALSCGVGISIIEKIGEHFSFSNGFNFKYLSTDDDSDFPDAEPEPIQAVATSLSFGYSKSDWNGIFMSTNSAAISAEFGLTDSEDKDFRYPMGFSFSIAEQHPIFTPRLRMYQKISGYYGRKNHISAWKSGSAGSVSILPGSFVTERIIGGNVGFEIAVKKFSWGMISIYSDYQIVYTQNIDDKYKFEHGPNGGARFYLAKIAFPAIAMGLAYNVPHNRWQFSAAMGVSF